MISFDTKMSLNNMDKVGTSLLDVQSKEMQHLEKENDANTQQMHVLTVILTLLFC